MKVKITEDLPLDTKRIYKESFDNVWKQYQYPNKRKNDSSK